MAKNTTSATTNAKVNKVTKKSKQEKANTEHNLPVIWTATEPGPHKRWWWYIGFCIVMLWLIGLSILLCNWFLLACVVAATIAGFVTYARAPQQLNYRLDKKALTVNRQTLKLDDFRAFTIEAVQTNKHNTQSANVLLLPKRLFGIPSQITMPENADETDKILNAFSAVLPFDEANGYLTSRRVLDRLAHWLRLN